MILSKSTLSARRVAHVIQHQFLIPTIVFHIPISRLFLRTWNSPTLIREKILVALPSRDGTPPQFHIKKNSESLLLASEIPYRPFGRAILGSLPNEDEKWVVTPNDIQPSRVDGPRGFQAFYSEYRFHLTVIHPTRYFDRTIHWTVVQLHLTITGALNIDWTEHREI